MSTALAIVVTAWPAWSELAIALVPVLVLAACLTGVGAMIALGTRG